MLELTREWNQSADLGPKQTPTGRRRGLQISARSSGLRAAPYLDLSGRVDDDVLVLVLPLVQQAQQLVELCGEQVE